MASVELPQGTITYTEEGRADAPPVVLLHGIFLNGAFWREVVPRLRDDLRVIVPDLPLGGHRVALKPDADLSTVGVARLIADLLEALDLRDVTLVGNDTGGAWGHVAATRWPDRIGRLVLSSCDMEDNFVPPMFKPLGIAARVPGSMRLIGAVLSQKRLQRLPNAFGWLSHRPMDPDLVRSFVEGLRADAGVRRDTAKVLRGIDSSVTVQAAKDLQHFDRPALFAWAAEDRFFPAEQAQRIAASMPDARYEPIEDSWTYTPVDQPARLAELIREFVLSGERAPAPTASSR